MNIVTAEKKSAAQITEQDILKSLEDAVSSFAKNDFQVLKTKIKKVPKKTQKAELPPPQTIETTVPQKKTKKAKVARETTVFPEDYKHVSEKDGLVSEFSVSQLTNEPIEVDSFSETATDHTVGAPKSKSVKSKKTKKAEQPQKKKNKNSKKKSFFSFKRAKTVILPEKNSGFYQTYKKQFATTALTMLMLSFVTMSSYIAYAYVANSNNDLVGKVGTHVILPVSESPKVYIIQSEKSEIFRNPLFKGIQVGDNVLSYTQAGKVVIYRSAEDKIVNIVNTSQFSAQ